MKRSTLPILILGATLLLAAGCGDGGELVINEFVASNASGHTDESGAYPDWIELYNTTSAAISLGDYAVSDDPADLGKNPLTDALELGGHGYQILFADGDVDQGATHLSFRLKAGGEEILLSRDDGEGYEVIDQIAFGEQETDVATGRVPDGTGEWSGGLTPTPGAAND
jgi:hypothetical protein